MISYQFCWGISVGMTHLWPYDIAFSDTLMGLLYMVVERAQEKGERGEMCASPLEPRLKKGTFPFLLYSHATTSHKANLGFRGVEMDSSLDKVWVSEGG